MDVDGKAPEPFAHIEEGGLTLTAALARLRVAEAALRNERALRDERSPLEPMLDALPVMIWYKDTDNRVVRVNRAAAAIEGVTPAALQGRSCWELYPRELADAYFADDRQVIESRKPKLNILEGHKAVATGEERFLEVSKLPVIDPSGEVIGVVAMAIDVTEKRRMQQALQDAQRLESLGVLAGGIAHDFNNVLAAAFGWLERARRAPDCGEVTRAQLDQSASAFERARELTRQLITFARGGAPAVDSVDLTVLLRDEARFVLAGSAVRVVWELAPNLPYCRADRSQMGQVFANILLNAREAMPEGGTVTISARLVPSELRPPFLAEGSYVNVVLSDTGPGIAPDVLPRVFDPFFTTKATGHGLGLSTSWSILFRHRGHLEVSSARGQGARFSVWLPTSEGPPKAEVVAGDAPAPARAGRVLVMDDEAMLRTLLRCTLEDAGWEVDEASHGGEAVARLLAAQVEGRPPDLAILDLTVRGGKGGKETLGELRVRLPLLPVIASSGYSDDPIMADPLAHGFDGALPKPWLSGDLLAAVARVMRERSLGSQPRNEDATGG